MADFTEAFHHKVYRAILPTSPDLNQRGRTILVTGGGSGIGLSIAQAFTIAGAAHVIILGRRLQVLNDSVATLRDKYDPTHSCKFSAYACDINDPSSIAEVWTQLTEQNISVDTLILNAAKANAATDVTDVIAFFTTNVQGNLVMLDHFKKQGPAKGKVVINVSTLVAHWNPSPMAELSASKAGFASLLQSYAGHVDAEELLMVSFHPGMVLTDGARALGFGEDSANWDDPELPAGFCLWLTKQKFLQGRFVWTNWDVDELIAKKEKILADDGMLKIGLQGIEHVSPASLFAKIAAKDAKN